jgi:hypothetical protein
MPVVAGAALIVLAAAFGANSYGGVSTAPAHVSTKSYSRARSIVALKRSGTESSNFRSSYPVICLLRDDCLCAR